MHVDFNIIIIIYGITLTVYCCYVLYCCRPLLLQCYSVLKSVIEKEKCKSVSTMEVDDQPDDCDIEELASTDGLSDAVVDVRKRPKKQTSPIWTYFEKCEDEPNFARCIICGSKYQHSSNTSNLGKVILILILSIMYYYYYFTSIQHLKTKHVKEWQACEEEKKEMELAKKRKSGALVNNTFQPTLPAVINRSSMYPST